MPLLNKIKRKDKEPSKYYSLDDILSLNAVYNVIFGERSSGKTFSCLAYSLEKYFKTGKKFAYVRKQDEDLKGKRGAQIFQSLVAVGLVKKFSKGEWDDIYYYSGRFYPCKVDDKGKRVIAKEPCGYAFSISAMVHDKSTSYPSITTIILDEFISKYEYDPDEFTDFMNIISTIVRERDDVKIFMLGNTVNLYSIYFKEMGLYNVRNMRPGQIEIYKYSDERLTVAVEYTGGPSLRSSKPSDFYFAFDNPKLKMITGGEWEIGHFPHLPAKFREYKDKDIRFSFLIKFEDDTILVDVVKMDKALFAYAQQPSSKITENGFALIYSQKPSPQYNHHTRIDKPTNRLTEIVNYLFANDLVFYHDNTIGNIVQNYISSQGKMQ